MQQEAKIGKKTPRTYWLQTLGCPKNQVDSDKIEGTLIKDGMSSASSPESADLVLVNTCAFIEEARQESLETISELAASTKQDAKIVVTGCMAERYGPKMLNQVHLSAQENLAVVPISTISAEARSVPVSFISSSQTVSAPDYSSNHLLPDKTQTPSLDLLNLPRPPAKAPWAYIKIAEGCDRKCGYCAIPSFRGSQRSRQISDILQELEELSIKEAVLVAQDLAAYGRDKAYGRDGKDKNLQEGEDSFLKPEGFQGQKPVIALLEEVAKRVEWVRLLYLYPSDLTEDLIDAILKTPVPYFDLSLQHASRPLLKKMRRFGSGEIFLQRIADIRAKEPSAVFRSNFIVGYPGETEADHQELMEFIELAQLNWAAFFLYSEEDGTYAKMLGDKVPTFLASQRRAELQSLQLDITEAKRDKLVGTTQKVLVDAAGEARSFMEAPEIDGIIHIPQPHKESYKTGDFLEVKITGVSGCDLHGELA